MDSKIRTDLRNGNYGATTKDDFEHFYKAYFLSRWSVQEDIRQLPHYRQELSSHFRSAVPGPPRDDLTRLTLDFLKQLVRGDYHPAVKINAVLAIGELNSVEQSGRVAAVPLPEALDVLLAAANSSKFSDAIRVAAMVGVLRHASAGTPTSETQKKISDVMLRLAAGDLPAGAALSARGWLVARAVETLGTLGSVGENNEVFTAVLKTAADTKLPLAVRCAAADALGRLNYASADGINPVETAAVLGRLAIDTCKAGLAQTKDAAGVPFRRRLLCRLDAVLVALSGEEERGEKKACTGIVPLAKQPPEKAFIASLQKAITDAIDKLDYKENIRESPDTAKLDDMKEPVTKLQQSLEQLLQQKP